MPNKYVVPYPSGGYTFDWYVDLEQYVGSPEHVMDFFKAHPDKVFPFGLGTCTSIVGGETCHLIDQPFFSDAPVTIVGMTETSFTFETLNGHFDPKGSTITFTIYQVNGEIRLRQTAIWNGLDIRRDPLQWSRTQASRLIANLVWAQQAENLGNAMDPTRNVTLMSGL